MDNTILTNYVFDAPNGTITIGGGAISIEKIYSITNLSQGVEIYNVDKNLGTISLQGNVIFIGRNRFKSSDLLRIEYTESASASSVTSVNGYTGVVVLTKSDIGLGNVQDIAPNDMPVSSAQATADTNTLNSAKAYADGLVVGMLDDRGNHDASTNLFPATGGSGVGGAILKGDLWTISVNGTLGGEAVTVGDVVRALVDTPAQVSTNWAISQNNIGYVPENADNKKTTIVGNENSNIFYATIKAIVDWVTSLFVSKANNLSDLANTNTALNNLLPTQTGNANKLLRTNGTSTNWETVVNIIGYTPEDVSNKKTVMIGNEASNIFYLSAKAVYDWAIGIFALKSDFEVIVKSTSDLPPAVGGFHDLVNNTTYRFKGLVNIGTNQIRAGVSNTIFGNDKSDDGIIYTGTASAIVCTDKTLTVSNILISAPSGSIFDVQNSTSFSFQARENIFASGALGTINGCNLCAFNNNIIASTVSAGIVFTGTINKLAIALNFFENTTSTNIIHVNGGTYQIIKIAVNEFSITSPNMAIRITNPTITGGGNIIGNGFSGTGTPLIGVSDDSETWILEANGEEVTSTSLGLSPNTIGVLRDDFEVGGNETGEVGSLGWQFTNGTITTPANAGEANHNGIIQRVSSNSNGQVSSTYLGRTTNAPTTAYQDFQSCFWIVRPNGTLANYRVSFGFSSDWGSATPTHAVYFRKTEAFGTWRLICRNGGVETEVNSGVTITSGTWYKLHFHKVDTGLEFFINNVSVGTITTNLPDNADLLHAGNYIIPLINATQSVDIDFFSTETKTTGR